MKYFVLVCFCTPLLAEEINTTFIGKLAVDGYDVVAYFKEEKPVKGNSKYQFLWRNAVWKFSTEENLNLFKQTPEKFAPQYGGYCAFAMSEGEKYDISPEVWDITEGKLYLNYNKEIQEQWIKNKKELIIKADRYWRKDGK
ncbi:YHS domain-containing (seleno)protein [Leptospira vanthielii]|uniref:YHS domain protein n=1 Tax=Leptospira vanthielii TaxID=293085 RepID=A0ABY2NQ45_9LEPT|nr:YHS domain-containing (seleno)protein [Leptospira vanthielii]TGM58239.1 YHS domain protein [Leptospira vanthielii]